MFQARTLHRLRAPFLYFSEKQRPNVAAARAAWIAAQPEFDPARRCFSTKRGPRPLGAAAANAAAG